MYTRPATTVGLASSRGAGLPVTDGGWKCHTWLAAAALDGVNAVARLIELGCGPCRYCRQSRLGPVASKAPAAAPWDNSNTPASPSVAVSVSNRGREPSLDIAHPSIETRLTLASDPVRQWARPGLGDTLYDLACGWLLPIWARNRGHGNRVRSIQVRAVFSAHLCGIVGTLR